MKLDSPIKLVRGRYPVVIGDDLRLIIPSGANDVQLTPSSAMAIGNRLVRQAAIVAPELVEPKRRQRRPGKKDR